MKVIKFRGKRYAWNWKGSPLHIAGIMAAMMLSCGCLWFITCGFAALPLE